MPLNQINSTETNVDWVTPRYILNALGAFDLDPCCPPTMPWRTASTMIHWPNDGLMKEWIGRVWMNPPFNKCGIWAEKMRNHGDGIALFPSAVGTKWFHREVFSCATGILFMEGRETFFYPDGTKASDGINRDCCLVSYGIENLYALKNSKINGKLIQLNPYA